MPAGAPLRTLFRRMTTVTTIEWNDNGSDWDVARSENGVVHDSVSDTDFAGDSFVEKGYPVTGQDLQLYYTFHEDSGTTLYEQAGGGVNGSIQNANIGDPGLLGRTSFEFDPSFSSYVDISGSGWPNDDISISVWVNADSWSTDADDEGSIFHLGDTPPQIELKGVGRDNAMAWFFWDGSSNRGMNSTAGATLPSTNAWHHLVGTYNSSTGDWKYYLDGTHDTTVTDQVNISNSGTNSRIGDHPSRDGKFDGHITEMRVYQRVLSNSDVSVLYDAVAGSSQLTTTWKSINNANVPVRFEAETSIPAGGITATVAEDVDQDGVGDNNQQVSLSGGSESFQLNDLSGGSNVNYAVMLSIDPGAVTDTTPSVDAVRVIA